MDRQREQYHLPPLQPVPMDEIRALLAEEWPADPADRPSEAP